MKQAIILFFSFSLLIGFTQISTAQCGSSAVQTSNNKDILDIVDIAASAEEFSTLVAAIKAAGLVETLKSDGPFTVFAPTNDAFAKLPEGTVNTLLQPENKADLTAVLTYHVIAGKFDSNAVVEAIKKGNGSVTLTTVQGSEVTAMMKNGKVYLKDAKGNLSQITAVDLAGSNGVIHVIDSVILP